MLLMLEYPEGEYIGCQSINICQNLVYFRFLVPCGLRWRRRSAAVTPRLDQLTNMHRVTMLLGSHHLVPRQLKLLREIPRVELSREQLWRPKKACANTLSTIQPLESTAFRLLQLHCSFLSSVALLSSGTTTYNLSDLLNECSLDDSYKNGKKRCRKKKIESVN